MLAHRGMSLGPRGTLWLDLIRKDVMDRSTWREPILTFLAQERYGLVTALLKPKIFEEWEELQMTE